MCLAIPARIVEMKSGDDAVVELDGVRRVVSLALVADAMPGDYVIVHVGYALSKLDPVEAEKTLQTMRQAGLLDKETLAAALAETEERA